MSRRQSTSLVCSSANLNRGPTLQNARKLQRVRTHKDDPVTGLVSCLSNVLYRTPARALTHLVTSKCLACGRLPFVGRHLCDLGLLCCGWSTNEITSAGGLCWPRGGWGGGFAWGCGAMIQNAWGFWTDIADLFASWDPGEGLGYVGLGVSLDILVCTRTRKREREYGV